MDCKCIIDQAFRIYVTLVQRPGGISTGIRARVSILRLNYSRRRVLGEASLVTHTSVQQVVGWILDQPE